MARADGEQFGPYELIELLGRGGMGEVWEAYDQRRDRTVALKRLVTGWAHVPEFRERFRREARAAARLDSAHVVPIHDFGEIDERLFIDMRLIRGGDLAGLVARHPAGLDVDRAVELLGQIASALEVAHRDGLVHRDLKPSNVLVEPDGARELAYLVDFGIAKIAEATTAERLTATGATLGTPAYMAPELFLSADGATPASDVYALGCVLFEMLTGRRAFPAADSVALIAQHLHAPPPLPSQVHERLAPFDPVVARCLAKEADRRHAGAGAFAADVADAARQLAGRPRTTVEPPPVPADAPERPATEPVRSRSWLAVAVITVLVLVAAGVGIGVLATRASGGGGTPASVGSGTAGPPAAPLTEPTQVPIAVHYPEGVVFSPDGHRAYMVNTDTETIAVIDTATRTLATTIPVPGGAGGIAISDDGHRAYVPNFGTDRVPGSTLSVVDLATDAVTARVPVGSRPYAVALGRDGRHAYVTNFGTDPSPGSSMTVVDTGTNTVTATVAVGRSPTRPAVSPDGTRVYVPFFGPNLPNAAGVTVYDTASGATSTLPSGDEEPVDAVVSPDGRRLYLATLGPNGKAGGVQVVDTVAGTVASFGPGIPGADEAFAMTADGSTLVIANGGIPRAPMHVVSVVDTATGTVRRSVTTPGQPNGVGITPDGREAWVTTNGPDALWRIPVS